MLNFPKIEKETLKFWQGKKIFKKSLKKDSPKGDFVFYDGPPFATGTPHYGNLIPGTIKDVIPRYKTMQGYHVERKWGWDCHGLPIENIIEQKLNLKTRQDIDKIGIENFCESCRAEVLKYAQEWRIVVERLGRWVDMDNGYRTMNPEYMESIWWVFKSLGDKGLIYEGFKSMHLCPRCETTLSNFEVTLNYKDINNQSITVKFPLVEEPNTYLLAWTTTSWTLPGNVALAVNKNIDYVLVQGILNKKLEATDASQLIKEFPSNRRYPVASLSYKYIISEKYYYNNKQDFGEIINRINVKELIGRKYQPLFDYYTKDEKLLNRENGWQVYPADFVTTDEGTGIVHIAPAFGEEDMTLAQEKNLPFIQHVDESGKFKPAVKDWAGELVKPRGDPQSTDIKIVEWLEKNNKLFNHEIITHSYPHCWRCDTSLINYAAKSWFVKVTEIKDKLIKNNKLIKWVPEHMKEGRFGKWLEQAKDWAISRSRFWGTPLPVWKCQNCKEIKVIGSIEELKETTVNKITKLILIRHGESEKNIKDIFDAKESDFSLTSEGKKQTKEAWQKLRNETINKIYSSPLLRAKETAAIIADKFNKEIIFADELREIANGQWEDKTRDDQSIKASREAYKALPIEIQYITKRGETGESWRDCEERSYNFVKKIVSENAGQTIVLVTHQAVLVYLLKALKDLTIRETVNLFELEIIQNYAEPITLYIDNRFLKQIDIHKHRIDNLTFQCPKCSGVMKRIPEVLDCWFESGAMPYGQSHYPFDPDSISSLRSDNYRAGNKEKIIYLPKRFPAEFIAEGQDQTRGWFYTLLVLSTALFDKPAFLNAVVNGLVLAEDGKKMAKRLKNYPEPMEIINKYGADMLRFYLISNPVVRAEELRFSEKEVRGLYNKVIILLGNILSFYQLFASDNINQQLTSDHLLDRWLIAKTKLLVSEVTNGLDNYDLIKATKPIVNYINELSTWYLRRSRERFKSNNLEEKNKAQTTLSQCLMILAKVMAPFTPFIAEKLYQELKGHQESVHLTNWPEITKLIKDEAKLIEEMELAKQIVEAGLRERAEAGIKVRQPLLYYSTALVKDLDKELQQIIGEELNVKELRFGEDKLETTITNKLKEEGMLRELIRVINNLRKELKLTVNDRVNLFYQTESNKLPEVIDKYQEEIKSNTKCLAINKLTAKHLEGNEIKEVEINREKIKILLNKKF